MSNPDLNFLLRISSFLLFLSACSCLWTAPASAQSRALPKAGFNNYSGSPLPNAGGLSLQGGQDRPRGAPPEVYNPGEPTLGHKLVRWEPKYMPLRVFISPGKKLLEEPISQINAQRPQEVLALLKADPSLSSLSPCNGWLAAMNTCAKSGIEQWKEFQSEGLFSFEFVDDPSQANIFVFWTERFVGDEGAGGISTAGNTVAVLYDANEVAAKEAQYGQLPGTPVIIELKADSDHYDRLQARAAHEFGHALGIKEHSPYNEDLMCVNGIARTLSPSDRATIRWLYHQRTPYVMLPPIIARSAPSVQEQSQYQQSINDDSAGSSRPGGAYRINVSSKNRSGGSTDEGGNDGTASRSSTEREQSQSTAAGTSDFLKSLESPGKGKDERKKDKFRRSSRSDDRGSVRDGSAYESPVAADTANFLKSLENPNKNKDDKKSKAARSKKEGDSSPSTSNAPSNEPAAPRISDEY